MQNSFIKKQCILILICLLIPISHASASQTICDTHVKKGLRLQTQYSAQELSNNSRVLKKIESHYQAAIKQCPEIYANHAQLMTNLGIVYQHMGKLDDAQGLFKKVLALDPNMSLPYFQLAQLYAQQKLFALALEYYLKTLEIDPQNMEAHTAAKEIALRRNCETIRVQKNDILSSEKMYNTVACARIFNRAQKRFHLTRSIYVTPVNFWNILFDTSSAQLKPASFPQLKKMVRMMDDHPSLKLKINGHADEKPVNRKLEVLPEKYCWSNQCLSEYRAWSVKQYLTRHDIPENRMKIEGFGNSQTINKKNQALNRRVEIYDLDVSEQQ